MFAPVYRQGVVLLRGYDTLCCIQLPKHSVLKIAVFVTTIVAVLLGLESSNGQQTNYLTTGYGNNQHGRKTAYFWTYPERSPVQNRLMKITLDGRTCDAVHVNVLSRHGARYTSARDMRSFTALQRKLSHNFANQTYAFINTWVNNYPEQKAEQLSVLGAKEMTYLGKFYGRELRDLLNGSVSTEGNLVSARFAATQKIRTQQSAKWFYRGLTDALHGQELTNLNPEIRNRILRFFDNCKRNDRKSINLSELVKFEKGPIFQLVATEVTKRLGTNVSLTVADIKMIYRLCATELAIMNNADWCTLLTDKDREVLEYDNDIEEYLTRLYGHSLTGHMSCTLGRDIFTALDSAITENDQGLSFTKGVFQFGHSNTVTEFAAGLGLFNDSDSFRADNFVAMKNRSFKASNKDNFSTHFVFILYNCGGSDVNNYALKLYFNGEPLTIPKCNSDTCWYKEVRQSYKQFIDGCDRNSICAVNNPDSVG